MKSGGWLERLLFSPGDRLQRAAERGDVAEAMRLLERKVYVDHVTVMKMPTSNMISPLHLAARGGHLECVVLLVEHGAQTGVRGYWQTTVLDEWFKTARRRLDASERLSKEFMDTGVFLTRQGGGIGTATQELIDAHFPLQLIEQQVSAQAQAHEDRIQLEQTTHGIPVSATKVRL